MSQNLPKAGLIFVIPSLFALWLDLWSKAVSFHFFETHPQSYELIQGFLYFSRAENTGVAFGMFQEKNHIFAVLVALMAIIIPIYTLFNRKDGKLFVISMGLVYGGALGNLYDRWAIGYVRDFIDVRFGSYHYPVFNIADSFICIGVALLLLQNLWAAKNTQA